MHAPFCKLVRKAHAWLHHADRLVAEGTSKVWQGMSQEVRCDAIHSPCRLSATWRRYAQCFDPAAIVRMLSSLVATRALERSLGRCLGLARPSMAACVHFRCCCLLCFSDARQGTARGHVSFPQMGGLSVLHQTLDGRHCSLPARSCQCTPVLEAAISRLYAG